MSAGDPGTESRAAALGQPPAPTVPAPLAYRFARTCCRIGTTLLFDLKVHGLQHLPPTGGVLLLANHQSYLDPVLIATRLSRPVSYLAKSELFKHAAFSWLIRSLNAYPVKQGAGDVGAIRETIRRLNEGHLLTVFPEGTRTADGGISALQSGFALIVRKVHVPVIPVALDGSFQAWQPGAKLFRPGTIHVRFGPAMPLQTLRPSEIVTHVNQTLTTLFEQVRAERQQAMRRGK